MTTTPLDDCLVHDTGMLLHRDALALIRQCARPVAKCEVMALEAAHGRYLAEDVTAPRPIPAHDNAAVDGYAYLYADYDEERGTTLPVGARVAAGHALNAPVPAKTAARIFTGAVVPEGVDSIVMQEDVELETVEDGRNYVILPAGLKLGANLRRAGEDTATGDVILTKGTRLRPQELAAIAAAGKASVTCRTPLRIGLFSTGDELLAPGEDFAPGKVYDSNRAMLQGLAQAAGMTCSLLGVLPDRPEDVQNRLSEAAADHDMVLTSGGVSKGEEDHLVTAIATLGRVQISGIAIKPGRPMTFGEIGDCAMIGLPGNPVAVFVCFLLYVHPLLQVMAGGKWREPERYRLAAGFAVPQKKTGRREFLRATLRVAEDGTPTVEKFSRDGSGLITSLRAADGLIELPEDVDHIAIGDMVDFLPFAQFGILR